MPFFLRTRRLDLGRLERKPQENLEVVHAILNASIKDVLEKLRHLERNFYGTGKSALTEVKRWVDCVRSLQQVAYLVTVNSSAHIEEIIKRSADPKKTFKVDQTEINKLKEVYKKVREAVPSRFSPLMVDIQGILKYIEKYCLSFYDPESDVYLETALYYERQRHDFGKDIRECLDNINQLGQKFCKGGVAMSDLSSSSRELAHKGNASHAPFLLLFPEACESIRATCKAMKNWIETDGNYSLYIKNDVLDLEKKQDDLSKLFKSYQSKYYQVTFKCKQAQADYLNMTDEVAKLQEKEDGLLVEEETLLTETNEAQLEIEIKEYRREELSKKQLPSDIFYQKYNELSDNLRELKARLPFAKRELANVQYKLSLIKEKKEALQVFKKVYNDTETEMEQILKLRDETEEQLKETTTKLSLARNIELYKTSPDAIEKIFHDQPVKVNSTRLPGNLPKEDPFERGCQVVAQHIELDWPRLYRNLPFYPPRGAATIDQDIREFAESRDGAEELARKCLHRWRRFHTRAKLDDLKETLFNIKRHDVLQIVEHELNPPQDSDNTEEPDYSFIEPYLIPFLKEVERFDELRAANKI